MISYTVPAVPGFLVAGAADRKTAPARRLRTANRSARRAIGHARVVQARSLAAQHSANAARGSRSFGGSASRRSMLAAASVCESTPRPGQPGQ